MTNPKIGPYRTRTYGARSQTWAIQDVAEELYLDWDAVKELDKQYMREQLRGPGLPVPG